MNHSTHERLPLRQVHNSMEEFLDWTNRASLSDGKNSTEDVPGDGSSHSGGGSDSGAGVSPDGSGMNLEEEDMEEPPNLDALIDEDLVGWG